MWIVAAALVLECAALLWTRRQLTVAVRAERARFTTIFYESPTPKALTRMRDRAIVDVNAAYLHAFGVEREQIVGKRPDDVGIHIADREAMFEALEREGVLKDRPWHAITPDGVRRDVLLSAHVIELDGERLAMTALMDLTGYHHAIAAAREADARLNELATLVDVAFWVRDVGSERLLYASPGCERIWGRPIREARDWLSTVHPDDRERMTTRAARHDIAAGDQTEFRVVHSDGSVHWIHARIYCVRDDGGGVVRIAGVCEDVTARKQAELAAQASNERFQQLAESIREVFWMTDLRKQEMVYISPAYETIWGRTVASLYARPMAWIEAIHVEDRERVLEAARTKQMSGSYDERYRIVRPDGEIRWIRDRAFPVRDDDGNVVRVCGLADDITEQYALQQQMQQSQKLESIGLLAGGVAHDFNNILSVITANADLLTEALTGRADREMLDEIQAAAERAASLTRQLLAFSRRQVVQPAVLDVNDAVEETRRMLQRLLPETVTLRLALDPDVGSILIDPGQLAQVLVNLCVNARDAMDERDGAITIETCAAPGEAWLLVRDNGCGMTDEIKRRMFEPFFTTKEVGRGTGLGLSVVHGIVEQAHGSIDVNSDVGKGTTFRLRFPLAGGAETDLDASREIARGHERILLVDDDRYLRASASRALRRAGYAVVDVGSASEALAQLRRGARVDLLITDIVMPVMSGRELAEIVREEFPQLCVLYTSGYTDDVIVRQGVQRAEVEFLEKPFGSVALTAKVRALIDMTSAPSRAHRPSLH